MKILALDTSGEHAALALTDGGRVIVELALRVRSRHGETLPGLVERALADAGWSIGDVGLLAVGLGPGSFTGLRVGLATAKGLSVARGLPVVGVRTTRVLARGAFGALRVPLVDAHRGEVFLAAYEAGPTGALAPLLEETHGAPDAMGRLVRARIGGARAVVVGSGLAAHGAIFLAALGEPCGVAPPALEVPRASLLALEAEEALAARGPDDAAALEPLYVRASDAIPSGPVRRSGRAP